MLRATVVTEGADALAQRTGVLAALTHRQYRLLFCGQVLSGCGDWIDYVALVSLVAYQWRAGAGGLAAVAVAVAVPWLVVAPVAGVWADRLPHKAVMIGSDLARAVLVLCFLTAPGLPVLLGLLALKTAVGTLFMPAQQAAIRGAVPEGALLAATSLNTFANQATKIAGPALGGLVLTLAGAHGAFAVDAATFVLSALILSRLRARPTARKRTTTAAGARAVWSTGFRHELREGLSYVRRSGPLRMAVACLSATLFLVLMFDTLSPLLLPELGLPRSLYGAAVASVAVGAAVGSVAVGHLGRKRGPFTILGASQAATGVLVAAVGVAATVEVRIAAVSWLPVTVGIGLCSAGILVVFGYLVQRETPPELIGRVSTVAMVVPTALQLAAPLAGAALATWVGIGWVLTAAGGGLALLGGVCLWRGTGWTAAPAPAPAPESKPAPAPTPESESPPS
ncbi:MFS transporter [Streptomyces sp. NPDC091280]|uniref:MFS transporter n=1 Tax=Streptomyces sp. NPDC091280 TaxID=3365984 RepID=UPI00381A667F